MNIDDIKQDLLNDAESYQDIKISIFCKYLEELKADKKNSWIQYIKNEDLKFHFKKIYAEGLNIDGDIVSFTYRGKLMISLTYKAYKNLVLMKYPETKFDIQLVKENDKFEVKKESGKVFYTHEIADPFNDTKVIGAYCIIKNKKGECIETMSLAELEKIKSKATMKYIWNEWENEMYLKSISRRACKRHYYDITANLDRMDNENFDLDQRITVVETKKDQSLELFKTLTIGLDNKDELLKEFASKDIDSRRSIYKRVQKTILKEAK